MEKKLNILGRTRAVLSVIGAASAVAARVEGHRKPLRSDLEILGIDPEAFEGLLR
jgi:hypothetical protein